MRRILVSLVLVFFACTGGDSPSSDAAHATVDASSSAIDSGQVADAATTADDAAPVDDAGTADANLAVDASVNFDASVNLDASGTVTLQAVCLQLCSAGSTCGDGDASCVSECSTELADCSNVELGALDACNIDFQDDQDCDLLIDCLLMVPCVFPEPTPS